LPQRDLADLKFSLATSYALEGNPKQLETAQGIFHESLEIAPVENRGYIWNNLGMVHFYQFIAKSSEITDPQGAGLDAIKPIVENFDAAVLALKKSVRAFEEYDTRFASLDAA